MAADCAALALTILLYMAFNFFPGIGLVVVVCMAAGLLLSRNDRYFRKKWILAAGAAAALLAGMIAKPYSLCMAIITLAAICALWNLMLDLKGGKETGCSRVLTTFSFCVSGLLCLVWLFLLVNAVNPDLVSMKTQKGAANYPTDIETRIVQKNGITGYFDILYDSTYRNNTYSVYALDDSKGVLFYLHGGGLVTGDKATNDSYLSGILEGGYSVVTVDYTLAPQDPFPCSVLQVNEALAYFVRHAEDYSLDASRIFVAGASAGAMLSGLLACINTDPVYAEKLGVTPALEGTDSSIYGFISLSGLVDVRRYSNTGIILFDWLFDTWGRSVFHNNNYAISDEAGLGSVLESVSLSFPPSYISDGNRGSFSDQGMDLAAKLKDLGIPVETNFPSKQDIVLSHVWELHPESSNMALDNLKRTLAFMDGLG